MRDLFIDLETYSEVSIADCGVYRYAMDPSFKILLVAYAVDDEPTQIIDLASGESLPDWFIKALRDPDVRKWAHNATFERVCFSAYFAAEQWMGRECWTGSQSSQTGIRFLHPAQWYCTMIQAARCGLPLSLKQVGQALDLKDQKMDEGKDLIQLFCVPRKVKKTEAGLFGALPNRVQPDEYPEKWNTFKKYCIRDVDVEKAIEKELSWYEVSDFEQQLYAIDQCINDRGAKVDIALAREAVRIGDMQKARLIAEAQKITGLSNPGSKKQIAPWIADQLGIELASLTKADYADIYRICREKNRPLVARALACHAGATKTSNAKYETMLEVAGKDDRVRGMLQFYGTRTGRWAGRFVQLQNLPQNHIEALDSARQMLKAGDYDSLELTFGNVSDTLSQLIRTAFIPSDGSLYAVCDFSAIEARVLAWMAGEDWVLDVFRKGGDIYCATASQMFHVPVEKHGQNAHLRQKGKVAVLALGYQGGVGALDTMGGARMGMTEQEEQETVQMWRAANPNIVGFWKAIETAAKECVLYKTTRVVETKYMKLTFTMEENGTMTIQIPSGRKICYPEAEVPKTWKPTGRVNTPVIAGEQQAFTNYRKEAGQLRFMGMNQTTKKWEWIPTYGGKITENITQAIARDCLAETMMRCSQAGFHVVFHIHDELVMEVPSADKLDEIQEIFKITPSWAKHLPLKGAGYTGNYYFKD